METGTHEALMQAGSFIHAIEERQGLKICCVEEIAYRMGYIGEEQLKKLAEPLSKNSYGKYLLGLLKDRRSW
jgi:glucose-1-phosphate thymidylyltransferase